jgi:hypothetical protein
MYTFSARLEGDLSCGIRAIIAKVFNKGVVHRTTSTEVVFQMEDNQCHISSVQLDIFITRINSLPSFTKLQNL